MTARSPRSLAELSRNVELLARTCDPPIRGPVLLASAGTGRTSATFYLAGAVATRLGVPIEVAGVLEPYPVLLLDEALAVYPPDVESIREQSLRQEIGRRLRALGPTAERWPVAIRYGDPARTIAAVARDRDATMIVVGLGKHGVVDRLPGGERALHVLRATDRPVLAVAPGSVVLPRLAVVGMDFSPASVRAARAALLMLDDDGLLVLVHVRPQVDLAFLRATTGMSPVTYDLLMGRWRAKADADAAICFKGVVDELRPYMRPGATIETTLRTGRVLEQIVAVADDKGAHMIAVGTHGAGFIERFFVGSIATEVVRHSNRTILVAPAPNAAECARLSLRIHGAADLRGADDWALALDAFSVRNDGRRVRLEVDDPDLGAQVQQTGFALLGVTFDRHDQRVDIMLGDLEARTCHLTRSIPHVSDVSILAAPNGVEQALRIESGRSQTVITFGD